MSDELIAVAVIPHCYIRLGWFSRAPLIWQRYQSGREAIVYALEPGPVYVSVYEAVVPSTGEVTHGA